MKAALIFSAGQRIRLDPVLDPHSPELLGLIDCMPAYEFYTMVTPFDNEKAVPLCNSKHAYLNALPNGELDWASLLAGFDAIIVPSQCHINPKLLEGIQIAAQTGMHLYFAMYDPRKQYWAWSLAWNFTYIFPSCVSQTQAEYVLDRACMRLPFEMEAGKYVLKGQAELKTHLRGYAGFQRPDAFRQKLMAKYPCLGIGPTEPAYRSITSNMRIDNGQELANYKAMFCSLFYLIGLAHLQFGWGITVRAWDGIANDAELAVPNELAHLFSKKQRKIFNAKIVNE